MRAFRRALGLELTPGAWRAVHLEARLLGLRVLGCAEDRFEAADPGEGRLEAPNPDGVAAALVEATQALGVRPGTRLGIALARPTAHIKRMALPRALQSRILEAVRAQAPALFPVGRRAILADVRVLGRSGRARGATAEGLVAAGPCELLEALASAAPELGLVLESADLSAAAVAGLLVPSVRRIFLAHDAGVERVAYGRRGSIDSSRFFPFGADGAGRSPSSEPQFAGGTQPSDIVGEERRSESESELQLYLVGGLPAEVRDEILLERVLVLGAKDGSQAVEPAADNGRSSIEAHYGHSSTEADYERFASKSLFRGAARRLPGPQRARFAAACGAACQALGARRLFDLRPDYLRLTRDRRRARRRGVLLGVLVLSLGLYGLVGFLRLRAAVSALERDMARLEPRVEEVLALQAAVTEATRRANLLAELEAAQPRWTSVLAEVARVLPPEAYLSALSERDGRLRLEGYAAVTSGVVSALQSSEMFDSVQLAGPVAPEQTPQGVRDRFAIDLVVPRGRRSP